MEVKINTQDSITTAQLIGRLDTPASQEISGDFDNLNQFLNYWEPHLPHLQLPLNLRQLRL